MRKFMLFIILLALAGCGSTANKGTSKVMKKADPTRLSTVLDAQPDEVKARYDARNPAKTLQFFGIAPGMTVVEGLPGGGWYTKILIDYVGASGRLIGADYAADMWPKFGFFDDAFLEAKKTWAQDWPQEAEEWRTAASAPISAFAFGALPKSMEETADAVVYFRVLHNLARFEDDGEYLTTAIDDTFRVLKPGGVVGIVQHEARDNMTDAFASGGRGYLKKAFVIEKMRAAGFEFVGSRDYNANAKDQPTEKDIVWRLPPSLNVPADDTEQRATNTAIGESNRMTLKFRKPKNR